MATTITQPHQSMPPLRPAEMGYLTEPRHRYNQDPILGKHLGLDLPMAFGIALRPSPCRHLRAVFGTKTSLNAQILTATEAAVRLADAIHDATMVKFGAKYERTLAWLKVAAKMPANLAPLLYEVGVRAALLAAIGGAQPMEHAHAA